jgi:hypothetical protein
MQREVLHNNNDQPTKRIGFAWRLGVANHTYVRFDKKAASWASDHARATAA